MFLLQLAHRKIKGIETEMQYLGNANMFAAFYSDTNKSNLLYHRYLTIHQMESVEIGRTILRHAGLPKKVSQMSADTKKRVLKTCNHPGKGLFLYALTD